MDMMALLLSLIQFAFTITFHIIFPSFTIGLAAWFTHQLQCFQGQGPSDRRALLVAASNPRITNGDRAFHPLLH
jgi:hypothetical protein